MCYTLIIASPEGCHTQRKLPTRGLCVWIILFFIPNTNRRETSPRLLRNWWTDSGRATSFRPFWASPAPARPSPWPISSIQALNRPTLIISHNKTLAGQLYGEMKEFFPENAVEYFVSYYDYYQPEAYIPSSDTYIAKDSMINDEIDKLRLSATASLAERRDVVVVASVSCIYGLGSPDEFKGMSISLRPGMEKDRDEVIKELIAIQYTRNDLSLDRCNFRVRGDTVEVYPAQGGDHLIRIEWFGDEIDRICEVEQLTGRVHAELTHVMIWPASHYVVPQEKINRACENIEAEMREQVKFFKSRDKLIEGSSSPGTSSLRPRGSRRGPTSTSR